MRAHSTHDRFYCNGGFAATTSLHTALDGVRTGVLTAQVRPPHQLGGAHRVALFIHRAVRPSTYCFSTAWSLVAVLARLAPRLRHVVTTRHE